MSTDTHETESTVPRQQRGLSPVPLQVPPHRNRGHRSGAVGALVPFAAVKSTEVAATVGVIVVSICLGVWVYRDGTRRGHDELAPFAGCVIGGLFLAGVVPSLVALTVSADPVGQGFPTALRIVPGFVALVTYLYFR